MLFTEKFPKNSKAADADYLRNDTADYQKWLEEVMTFSGSYREGFVLMIMFFVVTLRSTTSRSEVALKQLQIKLDDLWDIWKVRQVEFDQAFTQCLIRAGVKHFPYPVLQRPCRKHDPHCATS